MCNKNRYFCDKLMIAMRFFKVICVFMLSLINVYSQEARKILWDKSENKPISYATISSADFHTISNEDGYFEIKDLQSKILIQNVAYQPLELEYVSYKDKDTLFMTPNVYELDEVVVNPSDRYMRMMKTILTDYAMKPHQEKFFLRAVVRKNGEFYKIVDFSGFLEKKVLFSTKLIPMPKDNYTVQIENIRKVGREDKKLDYGLLSFKELLNGAVTLFTPPETFNYSVKDSESGFYEIKANSKEKEKIVAEGRFLADNSDDTFHEVLIQYDNKNGAFDKKLWLKYRTVLFDQTSTFKRNPQTNKMQLNITVIKPTTEAIIKDTRDVFEATYVFHAVPLENSIVIKNNININKDMFDLNGAYNPDFWDSNEVLLLTDEMQEFVNQINASGKKSDFRSITNMK
ncbi:MAG: hypothetical protein Q4G08_01370 [Capnocytophaga sp.]|nr:hypothetical protein [Capnocytophaga sp.]